MVLSFLLALLFIIASLMDLTLAAELLLLI
jgi:hypothetical protein